MHADIYISSPLAHELAQYMKRSIHTTILMNNIQYIQAYTNKIYISFHLPEAGGQEYEKKLLKINYLLNSDSD